MKFIDKKAMRTFLIGLLAGALVMLIMVGAHNMATTRARWGELPRPDNKVAEIIGMLERYSIIPFEREDLLTGMYRGLLDAVGDPYTQYFDAGALEAFQVRTEGVFAGIGVMSIMDPDTRTLTVGTVFRGSPAEYSGMMPGDKILAVDGADMVGRSQEYITNLIRGPVGEAVRLTILRPYDERRFEVDVIRALVEVPTVSHEMLDGYVGLLRIDGFDRVTAGQFNRALEELLYAGMQSLVVDVRNNPGGLMPVVVHITNRLVPAGIITYTEHACGYREYHHATGAYLGLPLAVLVNGRSASASEILAAAIQELGAGQIIGTQTFGKGVVQNLMYLSCGNAIKMTIAKYFTPNGNSINGIGVTPCIVVEMDEGLARRVNTLLPEEDVQLQAALAALGEAQP